MTWPDYNNLSAAQASSAFQSAASANSLAIANLDAISQLQLAVANLLLGDAPVGDIPAAEVAPGTFGASTSDPNSAYTFVGNVVSAAGKIVYGTTPGTTGAINVDASSYSTYALRGVNGTGAFTIRQLANSYLQILSENSSLILGSTAQEKFAISGASGTSTITLSQAIAQFVGGATSTTFYQSNGSTVAYQYLAAGSTGIGIAAAANIGIKVGGSFTASAGDAIGFSLGLTLIAAANNDVLYGTYINQTVTPGAFTGLVRRGITVEAFSVAAYTTPGNPTGINVGVITGTGASVATALQLAPPTGATTNYLIAHTTAATFNVTAAGAMTLAGNIVGANGTVLTYGSRSILASTADGSVTFANNAGTGFSGLIRGAAGGAQSLCDIQKVVTGIADNTATTVLTITVPNVAAGAMIRVTIVGIAGAGGAIGAYEDVTTVSYDIAVARTVGVAMGATASSAYGSGAAAVVGAGTMTCVAAILLNGEGVGATNTASFRVTIDQSSTSTNHRALVYAKVLNDASGGVTIS